MGSCRPAAGGGAAPAAPPPPGDLLLRPAGELIPVPVLPRARWPGGHDGGLRGKRLDFITVDRVHDLVRAGLASPNSPVSSLVVMVNCTFERYVDVAGPSLAGDHGPRGDPGNSPCGPPPPRPANPAPLMLPAAGRTQSQEDVWERGSIDLGFDTQVLGDDTQPVTQATQVLGSGRGTSSGQSQVLAQQMHSPRRSRGLSSGVSSGLTQGSERVTGERRPREGAGHPDLLRMGLKLDAVFARAMDGGPLPWEPSDETVCRTVRDMCYVAHRKLPGGLKNVYFAAAGYGGRKHRQRMEQRRAGGDETARKLTRETTPGVFEQYTSDTYAMLNLRRAKARKGLCPYYHLQALVACYMPERGGLAEAAIIAYLMRLIAEYPGARLDNQLLLGTQGRVDRAAGAGADHCFVYLLLR